MKKLAPVMLCMVFLLPLSARSEITAGSVEVSPFAGYNFFQERQNLDNRPLFGGRLGYNFTKYLGIEGAGEFINSSVDDRNKNFTKEGQFTRRSDSIKVTTYHLDLLYHFIPEGNFNPFITAGYGAAHYSPKINDKNLSLIDFGLGAKYWVANNIALRFDVRDNMILDEQIHNVQLAVGIVFAFGGKEKSAANPPARSMDSDGDGVPDTFDKCQGTPAGVDVDKDGCPLDTDKDGVPDYRDKCPGTPAGVAVDKNGCPLDADKDGVSDYLDKCPGTPAGVAVDKDGCPRKVVILVSEAKVEEKVVVAKVEPAIVVLAFEDIHFAFDKSTLTAEARTLLKNNIQLLKENPKIKVRVAGYTSASGTAEYNQKLSERRAKAVQEYLIDEGVITRDRLTTIGYGETHPEAYEAAPQQLYSEAAKANMRVLFEIILQEEHVPKLQRFL